MNIQKYLLRCTFFAIICIFIVSCTVAPIRTSTTARTLGDGKHKIGTTVLPVLGLTYEYGLKDDFDIGIGIERQLGLMFYGFGKYSFYQKQDDGFSHSVLFGAGKGFSIAETSAYYVGLMSSYRYKWIEPFLSFRYNYIKWKFSGLSSNDKDDLITVPSTSDSFSYYQADFALNFNAEKFVTTLGIHMWIFPDGSSAFPSLSFAWNF